MNFVYIFIGVILIKFLINLTRYIENSKLERIWISFYSDKNINAKTYTKQIQKHFKDAGITDSFQPITLPTGFGILANTKISIFDNIFSNVQSVIPLIKTMFLESRGVYRSRMFDSFKISYWIKLIVFLPKNIILYLGLNSDTIFTKLFQVIFWVVDSILIVIYQDEIAIFVKNIIDYILQLFK